MSDLVARLRSMARHKHDDLSIGDEAADHIEMQFSALEDRRRLIAEKDVEIRRLRDRLKWFEYSGGVAVHAEVFKRERQIKRLKEGPITDEVRREWERHMLRPFDNAAEAAFRAMVRAALEGRDE